MLAGREPEMLNGRSCGAKGLLGIWEDVLAGHTEGMGGEECMCNVSYQ